MESPAHGKENMHIIQVPTSPSFLKPKPIKLRKRNKKSTAPLQEIKANSSKIGNLGYLIKSPKIPVNPFRCSENKRKRDVESFDEDSNSLLWKRTNNVSHDEVKTLPSPIFPSLLDENALSAFSLPLSPSPESENSEQKCEKIKCKNIPVDWCLKTKIRFTSATPFPSRGSFRTFEEVNGTVGFVRCLHSGEATNKSSDIHSSFGAKFFQRCLVWMHPYLPMLNLFPRTDDKIAKQNSPVITLDAASREILHSKWCDSFRSLYQLVRLFQCPYFYMCAPTFTVLFRCAGTASIPVIHTLISPTTKGFRKALKEEGIEFTMPLCQNKDTDELDDSTQNNDLNDACEDGDTEQDTAEDDEPETWLESLGLSQDNFPSLNRIKRRDGKSRRIDHEPQSLVYIEDSETQALVNFLLNSHLCTSKIGPMAGIPPTLLAPTAFLGGVLDSLKIRHGKVRNNNKEYESVEISGPLLPNSIHSLCSLFNTTQEGNYSAVLTSHSPTSAFSMVTPQSPMLPCIFAKNNITDCGLPEEFVQKMCSKPEEGALNSVVAENGLFSWK